MSRGLGGVVSSLYGATSCLIEDEDKTALYKPGNNWSFHMRNAQQVGQALWKNLWPQPSILCGDPSVSLALLGQDGSDISDFEPFALGYSGVSRPWHFQGTIKDSGGTPVSGVMVHVYRDSDDLFISAVYSNTDGTYDIPVPNNTDTYYLRAYNGGNNQTGASIQGLTPTL